MIRLANYKLVNLMEQQKRSDQGKFMQVYNEPLSPTGKCVRYPMPVHEILGRLPDQSGFIRTAVIEKLIADGLLDDSAMPVKINAKNE